MKQIWRSESGGGSRETREILPVGNAVERTRRNANNEIKSHAYRHRGHRLSSASELSTRNFTEFSSFAKTISALRKKRRIFFPARPFVEMRAVSLLIAPTDLQKRRHSTLALHN